jgi:Putative zinc ribbon domain
MVEKVRCQSCGMPLGEFTDRNGKVANNYGTNADGTPNAEYCSFCFQNGGFTQPNLTLEGMIALSIENMTNEQRMPEHQARELANTFIPKLRRWPASAS